MLLLISGPSTVGKDTTWIPAAQELGFINDWQISTRLIRNKIDDSNYYSISINDFQSKISNKELLDWDFFDGNYYGIDQVVLQQAKCNNVVLSVLGRMAIRLKLIIPNCFTLMIIPKEYKLLDTRLADRGYKEGQLEIRKMHGIEESIHSSLFDSAIESGNHSIGEAKELLFDALIQKSNYNRPLPLQ